jgi:hypothetical protein
MWRRTEKPGPNRPFEAFSDYERVKINPNDRYGSAWQGQQKEHSACTVGSPDPQAENVTAQNSPRQSDD